jgi:acylphosphatase
VTESYRFVVTGRVQGVFFRQSTQQCAHRLGLVGWVRNRTDGAVEGEVSSDSALALAAFRAWLDQGPPAARVDSVEWMACEAATQSGFEVLR